MNKTLKWEIAADKLLEINTKVSFDYNDFSKCIVETFPDSVIVYEGIFLYEEKEQQIVKMKCKGGNFEFDKVIALSYKEDVLVLLDTTDSVSVENINTLLNKVEQMKTYLRSLPKIVSKNIQKRKTLELQHNMFSIYKEYKVIGAIGGLTWENGAFEKAQDNSIWTCTVNDSKVILKITGAEKN